MAETRDSSDIDVREESSCLCKDAEVRIMPTALLMEHRDELEGLNDAVALLQSALAFSAEGGKARLARVARAAATQPEAATLPACEVGYALVLAQHGPGRIDDVAKGRRTSLAIDEFADAAVWDKTQLLGLRLVRVGHT